ncbi:redoxin domain-containing protein [Marinigracilibium pacificum]|uniref:Redoxin domain-containing protein n=1 Tax=Marinigracilibium pacificum TaxID=2729599 RepID=A0A848IYV3_9BACT|nr:redoxin domain-containing protein [Marinigracilibium pacificum]NMM48816.1 redoxin domain-containing protein [Marinigracilibium pacificum]
MLQTKVIAPIFHETDIFDREINLAEYTGKKILVAFFRHAGCPFCNLRVHTLVKFYEELNDPDFKMIFFFESKRSVLERSTFHQEVSPVPIISDPEKIIYEKYGLEQSAKNSAISHITSFVQTAFRAKMKNLPMGMPTTGESLNTMPAEFLIDKDLTISHVHYSQRLNDRMDLTHIKNFISN